MQQGKEGVLITLTGCLREVTKLLYVPLALAATVNSLRAFMQISLNTFKWPCQEDD